MEEGGGETSTYPFEQWRYRYIEGIGTNVIIEFVDPTMSGEYHMTMDPSEKDALLIGPRRRPYLLRVDGPGLEERPLQPQRRNAPGHRRRACPESMKEFTRLEKYTNLQKPPTIKFKDLEAQINSTINYNTLPMKVHVDYIRVTDVDRADQHHRAVRKQGTAVCHQGGGERRPRSTCTAASRRSRAGR